MIAQSEHLYIGKSATFKMTYAESLPDVEVVRGKIVMAFAI